MNMALRLFLGLVLWVSAAEACTVFGLNAKAGLYVARNFDFPDGNGFMTVNAPGVSKQALVLSGHEPLRWTSDYGSLTLNQIGVELPNEGINSHGLMVTVLWCHTMSYELVQKESTVNELQVVQFVLDKAKSIAEAKTLFEGVQIAPIAAPLHYFLCDPRGCAIFEIEKGKLKVYEGSNLPYWALANDAYQNSLDFYHGIKPSSGGSAMDVEITSEDRFREAVTSAGIRRPPKGGYITYAFERLKLLAQGDFTKWHVVYDISRQKIYLRRNQANQGFEVSLPHFKYPESKLPQVFDLRSAAIGNVGFLFRPDPRLSFCASLIQSMGKAGLPVDPRLPPVVDAYVRRIHPTHR